MGKRGRPSKTAPNARDIRMMEMYRSGLTLQKIGDRYKVTRERVRQILRQFNCTANEGGQTKRGRENRARAKATRDARYFARCGCTFRKYKLIQADGGTRKFKQQRTSAQQRGIAWRLSLNEWWTLWQESGHWAQRGRGSDRYCMARISDKGCYEAGNVYVTTNRENGQEYAATRSWAPSAIRGVYRMYPGNPKPYLAKVGKKFIGTYATGAEGANARAEYVAKHGIKHALGRQGGGGRGFTIIRKGNWVGYQVVKQHKYIGTFKTPEAARAAYLQAWAA